MPANYFHIYNEGGNGNTIFNDQEDYDTFLKFINEYVNHPIDPKTIKKSFTVAGKTYHGIPHLPKNYFNKVVLVGYSLISTRFNLVLQQNEDNAVESFIRSLCTRYSIYFNKKYKRTGSLFAGPYKSVKINSDKQLSILIRFLHQMGGLSSIHQYLDSGVPSWLNHPAIKTYKDFLNDYTLTNEENNLLNEVAFKQKTFTDRPIEMANQQTNQPTNQKKSESIKIHQRRPELIFASTVFVILFFFGFRNIVTKNANAISNTPEIGQVAGANIVSLDEIYNNPTKIVAYIKTDQPFVKVYRDMDILSDIVAEAFNYSEYEIVAKNDMWYEIQLPYYQKGFVEAKYVTEMEVDAK